MSTPVDETNESQAEVLTPELREERRRNDVLAQQNEQLLAVLGQLTVIHSLQRLESQRFREVAEEATTDELTQLPNKRGLMEAYETLQRMHGLEGWDSAVLFIDLDGFKEVNDTYGHVAGDKVLISVTRNLAERLRGGDVLGRLHADETVVGRLQGDEIVALLPGATPKDALTVAEELRQIVGGTETEIDGQLVRITASVGVSQYSPELPFVEVIRKADEAMYKAKQNGKDQVFALED